jgi:hypothetical protein
LWIVCRFTCSWLTLIHQVRNPVINESFSAAGGQLYGRDPKLGRVIQIVSAHRQLLQFPGITESQFKSKERRTKGHFIRGELSFEIDDIRLLCSVSKGEKDDVKCG